MLILLPPSEGKTVPQSGPRLVRKGLSFPELDSARTTVADALVELCRQPTRAAKALGLSKGQTGFVALNAALFTGPVAPAIDVYSGVLFEALDAGSLGTAARRRLAASVAIASALWGLLRTGDLIPAYRLSADVSLPGVPAGIWREPVGAAIARARGPILDLRSGAYQQLAPIPAKEHDRAGIARVLLRKGGKLTVVSHHNKATKGRLVRALVEAGPLPRTREALLAAIEDAGYRCEVGAGSRLDIITTSL